MFKKKKRRRVKKQFKNLWRRMCVRIVIFWNIEVRVSLQYTRWDTVQPVRGLIMPGLHSHRDSMEQDENESVKGTLVSSSTLSNLFSPCLEALGDMWVNQPRVKGNENVSNILPRRRFSHESVNVVHISPKVSMSTRYGNINQTLHQKWT